MSFNKKLGTYTDIDRSKVNNVHSTSYLQITKLSIFH